MKRSNILGLMALLSVLVTSSAVADEPGRGPLMLLPRIFGQQAANPAPILEPLPPPPDAPAPAATTAAAGGPVPVPRLRPPVVAQVAAVEPTASAPAPAAPAKSTVRIVTAPPPPSTDRIITGAIDPTQSALPADGAGESDAQKSGPIISRPAPATASSAFTLPPLTGGEPDGLLGDPAGAYPVPPPVQPQAPLPQGIDLPRAGAVGVDAMPLPPAPGNQPYERLRQLQAIQDRTAQGSIEALAAQRALIAAMDQAFNAADPQVWSDPRNAIAAVGFVLGGGPPTILARLAALDPKPAIDERLVKGVLAYAQGREGDANAALGPLDATGLPASIAAPVAMAQSALAVRTDPQLSLRLLSLARLLAPGTLVEEAAIRREIFVADQLRDDGMVQSLARQYLDRFRHSVYAGNFRDRFAAALSHMDFINDPAQFPRLDDMLASVEPDGRADLYLTVALASVVNGRTNAASLAATRVLALTTPGSVSETRARLYRAAALVASAATFDGATADYATVDRNVLSVADQGLYEAVGAALAAVGAATEVKPPPLRDPAQPDQPSALMARATAEVKAIDAILATRVQ